MCRITYFPEHNQIKFSKKVDLINFIFKYDVIYDAFKIIRNKNLKRQHNFGDIGSFVDMGTDINLGLNCKIA